MTSWKIGLPMYWACAPDDHRLLLQQILKGLREEGWTEPVELVEDADDLDAFWRSDRLLLGQACGYPLMTILAGQVRLIGTPAYTISGCDGHRYCSFIVVPKASSVDSLEDLRGLRAVFNDAHSQSGMNALRHALAPLARNGRFFSQVTQSGSHRASVRMIADGIADVAAVDNVTYGYLVLHAPQVLAGVRVLCQTAPMPGLPLIASRYIDDATANLLARVTGRVLKTDAAAKRLQLAGLKMTNLKDYFSVLQSRQFAIDYSFPALA